MAYDTSKSVLVVDDDEFVRTIVTRQLQDCGAGVAVADSGAAARTALRERGPFDLVICDLRMPGVDGVELLRDVAEYQPATALALMSSVDAQTLEAAEMLAQTRDLRFVGSLRKPVSRTAFRDLLERLDRPSPPRRAARAEAVVEVGAEELRQGIAAGHIDVYVQPKVTSTDGALVGAEALARWIRRDTSVMPPSTFIDAAERYGLMGDLTALVVRQAFAGVAQWREAGLPRLSIAVNIPVSCLGQLELPEQLASEAARHGVDPRRVILEITETGVSGDAARLLDVATRLRLRGFQLGVDDFGTGYSSLQRLKRLPFNELKIDRSFVNGCGADAKLRSIVDSTVRLARALRLSTCAEGVETQADLDAVRELGCDLVQGYWIARPMPKRELPAWAAARLRAGAAAVDPRAELAKHP